jgi:hypothetical protein
MAGDPSSSSIEGDLNGIDREGRHVRQAWPRAHVSFFMAAECRSSTLFGRSRLYTRMLVLVVWHCFLFLGCRAMYVITACMRGEQ